MGIYLSQYFEYRILKNPVIFPQYTINIFYTWNIILLDVLCLPVCIIIIYLTSLLLLNCSLFLTFKNNTINTWIYFLFKLQIAV